MKALSEGKLRNVMAFNITPVEDFDEITFHFLDVVHAKLALEKVGLGKKIAYFAILIYCVTPFFS